MNTIDGILRGIEEGARILQGVETKKPPCGGYFLCKTCVLRCLEWLIYHESGADTENRTRDLTLTKGALYQLSHISTK